MGALSHGVPGWQMRAVTQVSVLDWKHVRDQVWGTQLASDCPLNNDIVTVTWRT